MNLFKSEIIVYKPTRTKNKFGELNTISFEQVAIIKGDLQSKSGQLRAYEYGNKLEANYILFCEIAEIKEGYKIRINNSDYKVIFVSNIRKHHLEVDLALWV